MGRGCTQQRGSKRDHFWSCVCHTRRRVQYGVVEIPSKNGGEGKGAQPIIKGCSFNDGEQSMLAHNQKRSKPWEADAQCDAIIVAGCVQGAMPLHVLPHEIDHVGGDIIEEQRWVVREGACCMRDVCRTRAEAYLLQTEN